VIRGPAGEGRDGIVSRADVADGELAPVTDTVTRLTGHAPQSLAGYVRPHPDCLDHVVRASDIRPAAD
jgi:hypothetical protein